uniref:Uncharacterized protein n=1 Tax=Tanacetum cinerariifolium TaxID=118510 RepID=A0A6L2MMZ0_TANCI|nr:hypothetical protein [Tanacetum cinerariifolium]
MGLKLPPLFINSYLRLQTDKVIRASIQHSSNLSFFKNLLTQQTASSHIHDAGGDDVTYIGQQFTTDFPTLYNVDPMKVRLRNDYTTLGLSDHPLGGDC